MTQQRDGSLGFTPNGGNSLVANQVVANHFAQRGCPERGAKGINRLPVSPDGVAIWPLIWRKLAGSSYGPLTAYHLTKQSAIAETPRPKRLIPWEVGVCDRPTTEAT